MWTFTSNMTRGELDPQLVGRIDLQAYYSGVKTATNVLCIPQGGLKKRPGMEYVNDSLANGRLEAFSYSVDDEYLLAFTNGKMEVYKDGALVTNINGSGNDYLTVPWTLAQIQEFDYIQSVNTIIITHEDVEPRKIVRGASDSTWTLSTLGLTNVPQFDYNDGSSPTPTSQVQSLVFASITESDRFRLSLNGILTDEIVYSGRSNANEQAASAQAIKQALLEHPLTANDGVAVTYASADTFTVTFSGASAEDYEILTASPIYTQLTTFKTNTTITTPGVSRKEDVWSSTRGWPRTCVFHEGRLWFGGSKSRPATIWGSVVFDFFNFNVGRSLDDEAVIATLDTDQVNEIQGIYSNRALQIFTTGAEFYVPASPITPSNVAVKPQTNFGSKRVRPVTLSGVTYFLQRTGKVLNQFVYLDDLQANAADPVSILAPHLINSPTQMTIKRGSADSDVNYVYLVGNDGNLTVYNSVPSQAIEGFTSWQTDGNIKSVAVVDDTLYLLVEREINSSTVYFIEKENSLMNTDAGVRSTGLSSDTLTGLSHLNTETVTVKADGSVQPDEVVSGGQITIDKTADTIEAGLEYAPTIKTMPVNIDLQGGSIAGRKKKIGRVAVQVYESNGVIVNGIRLPDKTIGQDQFDSPDPQTKYKRIRLGGWSLEADVTITQDTPMPLQILSIGMEVFI